MDDKNVRKIEAGQKMEAHIHYLVAFIGGFLGLFPIVNVVNVLGSAQTTNLIEIVLAILVGDGDLLFFHGIGALIFSFAIFLATVIPKHTKLDIKFLAMIFDILCGIVMYFFPKNAPVITFLYPTFFALSFQWCAFRGAYGYVCSSIFSTNNLRMCISAFVEVFVNKDRTFMLKAKFFGATLIAFHFGIIVSWVCWYFFGNRGFLAVIIPAFLCLLAVKKYNSIELPV